MPQIANQDYNRLVDKRVTGDGNLSDVIAYGLKRALDRGTIFDVIVETGDRMARCTTITKGNGTMVLVGAINYGFLYPLNYSEETFATLAKISQSQEYPKPTYAITDGFLVAGETFISCNGKFVEVTYNDQDRIETIEVSDEQVTDEETIELTYEELQTLIGVSLF